MVRDWLMRLHPTKDCENGIDLIFRFDFSLLRRRHTNGGVCGCDTEQCHRRHDNSKDSWGLGFRVILCTGWSERRFWFSKIETSSADRAIFLDKGDCRIAFDDIQHFNNHSFYLRLSFHQSSFFGFLCEVIKYKDLPFPILSNHHE